MLEGAKRGCSLLVSELVLEETRRNLSAATGGAALGVFNRLTELTELQIIRRPSKAQVVRVAKIVNLKDAPIIAAAMRGKADYLATHDKELMRQADQIQDNFGLPVVAPGDILHLVRES